MSQELIERARKVLTSLTNRPWGSGVFAHERRLVWSDALAGQLVATCQTEGDADGIAKLPCITEELTDALVQEEAAKKAAQAAAGLNAQELHDQRDMILQMQRDLDAERAKVAELTQECAMIEGRREMAYRAYGDVLRDLDTQKKDREIDRQNAGKFLDDQRDRILELEARLAELDPPWSDEPPTVPGEYDFGEGHKRITRGQVRHSGDDLSFSAPGRIHDVQDMIGKWRPAPKTRDPWKEGE